MTIDPLLQLQNLNESLALKEEEYQVALKEDKEFVVLKESKTHINELKRKIRLYSEAMARRNSFN